MRTIFAYPGNGDFAQQVALALYEAGWLDVALTTVAIRPRGIAVAAADAVPFGKGARLRQQLLRRRFDVIPPERIQTRPLLEIARTVLSAAGGNRQQVDRLWDKMAIDFTQFAARLVKNRLPSVIYAYEYTALEAFKMATQTATIRVLDLPSFSSRDFEETLGHEMKRFPDLKSHGDEYFRRLFPVRQARRDEEIALADILVCNSTATRDSHVKFGAEADKMIVVPLGAPPTIESVKSRPMTTPLRLVWAGTFNIRKGAHYLVEACRKLKHLPLTVDVYGAVELPVSMVSEVHDYISFRGSIPRDLLFQQFEAADALIFPTLSDGFGMVVTEALARGLPVITTNRAGAADLIDHGVNGLIIPPYDAGAIRDAILWCFDNRVELSGSMRHDALATAKARQWSHYRADLRAKLGLKIDGLTMSVS